MAGSRWLRYGFAWVTLGFFVISLIGHWVFGWFAYVNEQLALNQPTEFAGYLVEVPRDTLENLQFEFLQLLWQVVGLALLLYVGSPQSKEGDDRVEAKIDALIRRIDPDGADRLIRQIDDAYAGRETDVPHGHRLGSLRSRCLVPGFDGAVFSSEWKDALWARFCMGAPARPRRSVERYSIVKRA